MIKSDTSSINWYIELIVCTAYAALALFLYDVLFLKKKWNVIVLTNNRLMRQATQEQWERELSTYLCQRVEAKRTSRLSYYAHTECKYVK